MVDAKRSDIVFENRDKIDIVKFLIGENNKELIFWRERNWSTLQVTVGSYIALAGVSYFKNGAGSLIFLVIGIAVLATIYLCKNSKRHQEARNTGRKLEVALGLFEEGVFIKEDILSPFKLEKEPKVPKAGFGSFIAAIWVIAIATIMAMLGSYSFIAPAWFIAITTIMTIGSNYLFIDAICVIAIATIMAIFL